MTDCPFSPGDVLSGKYVISGLIGQGTFASVFKAHNIKTNELVAMKIIPESSFKNQYHSKQIQHEIYTMQNIQHPALVHMIDTFTCDDYLIMVLEFCSGGDLFEYIAYQEEALPEEIAALLFLQICEGIAYCHNCNIAHRDIKLENILIKKFPQVVISDFGLCGIINNTELMSTFCGSPTYCPPECLRNLEYDGRQSDIWSLGVLLYYLIELQPPWEVGSFTRMQKQILKGNYKPMTKASVSAKMLVSKMLKVAPEERISIDEILNHEWLKNASKAAQYARIQQNMSENIRYIKMSATFTSAPPILKVCKSKEVVGLPKLKSLTTKFSAPNIIIDEGRRRSVLKQRTPICIKNTKNTKRPVCLSPLVEF